jgi:hypothetical protein
VLLDDRYKEQFVYIDYAALGTRQTGYAGYMSDTHCRNFCAMQLAFNSIGLVHAQFNREKNRTRVGERPYLTTKIITLSEFFNFVHQVSRL